MVQPFAPVTLGDVVGVRSFPWFGITHATHAACQRLRPHAHRYPALTLVSQGGFELDIDGEEVICNRRGVYFKLGEHRHANNFSEAGSEALVIELRTDECRIDDEIPLPDRSFWCAEPRAVHLAAELQREFRMSDAASALAIEGLVLELLARLLRANKRAHERAPDWLDAAEDLLRTGFQQRLGLGEVSSALGVHPIQVARTFRRHHGCSVGEFVRRLRTGFAATRLRETDRPLAEIALAAGFFDQSHFSRCFKRHFGVPPSRYRHEHRPSA